MKNKSILWLVSFFAVVIAALSLIAANVVQVDPYFHYQKPSTDVYFYPLDDQRSQNDGIVRHFDYTGLITGSSMTENFKTSEAKALWGGDFIKVPVADGSFRDISDNVVAALRSNPELTIVIRGLDMDGFLEDKDRTGVDRSSLPTYLYDHNVLNDVLYVFNRDVIFGRVYSMVDALDDYGFDAGITSFDQYSAWMQDAAFGKDTLFPDGVSVKEAGAPVHLTEAEAAAVRANVSQNLTAAAKAYPKVTFYYFITPCSAAWWMEQVESGTIYRQVEAERVVIEELLKYPNIRLFSYNCRFDLTTDLNNYKDARHYAEWINSIMLRGMHGGQQELTEKNYEAYLDEELAYYTTYDYRQLNDQPDYEDDYYAAFLHAKEAYGHEGREIDLTDESVELRKAELLPNQHEGKPGIRCTGTLQRNYMNDAVSLSEYLWEKEFIGFKVTIDDITPYKFLSVYGKRYGDHGQPTVVVYDKKGKAVAEVSESYHTIRSGWKQYVIDVTGLSGEVTVIFNGGYVDSTGSPDSQYIFSDVTLF